MVDDPTIPAPRKPKKLKTAHRRSPWISANDRLPYLDVEWGNERFVQIQYATIIDLLFKENQIRITSVRYVIEIKLTPPEEKPFDLATFRRDFQQGRVSHLVHQADFGFSIKVFEVTKEGKRPI